MFLVHLHKIYSHKMPENDGANCSYGERGNIIMDWQRIFLNDPKNCHPTMLPGKGELPPLYLGFVS